MSGASNLVVSFTTTLTKGYVHTFNLDSELVFVCHN